MRLIGLGPAGEPLVSLEIDHGVDPHTALWNRGLSLTRPVRAQRGPAGELVLLVHATPHGRKRGRPGGRQRPERPGSGAVRRQRVAAYAITLSDRGVLGTEFSDRTHVPGQWGLPGGGVDPGEEPPETVRRELMEEAGQRVDLGLLIDVQSDHWVGTSPSNVLEDFHALRLIYAADCPEPTDPVVHDVGGTTSAAAWIPLGRWREWRWTAGARALLERHLG